MKNKNRILELVEELAFNRPKDYGDLTPYAQRRVIAYIILGKTTEHIAASYNVHKGDVRALELVVKERNIPPARTIEQVKKSEQKEIARKANHTSYDWLNLCQKYNIQPCTLGEITRKYLPNYGNK